jgi:hypothetical protein
MTIPLKVVKSLFLRENSEKVLAESANVVTRDVAGRPRATGNVVRK